MATVRKPSSVLARNTRMAISPRFAQRIRRNGRMGIFEPGRSTIFGRGVGSGEARGRGNEIRMDEGHQQAARPAAAWVWGGALVALAAALRLAWVLLVPTVPVSDFA